MENLNLEAYIHTTIQLPYLVQQKIPNIDCMLMPMVTILKLSIYGIKKGIPLNMWKLFWFHLLLCKCCSSKGNMFQNEIEICDMSNK